jgi:phosphoribosylformimino-5-aminoimidazole carboxamide ribotide isomerase
MAEIISAGAARVIISTVAAESPESLEAFVHLFGARILVEISAKKGQVMTHGWAKQTSITDIDLACRAAKAGVKRIIYTDVSRDGTFNGINVEQACTIARASGLSVTASGGVSSLQEIARIRSMSACNIDSIIIGRALYEGHFTLAEANSHGRE